MTWHSPIRQLCLRGYLSQSRRIWNHLSPSFRGRSEGHAYGRHLHNLALLHAQRRQYFATFFLRNRPWLGLISRLLEKTAVGSRVDLLVLGCAKGAEVYSVAWAVRSARPDLRLNIYAVDISQEIVDFARQGIYTFKNSDAVDPSNSTAVGEAVDVAWNTSRDQNAWIFERMTKDELDAMFEIRGDQASVRPWIREGITWLCGDAFDPKLSTTTGLQDMVLANCFLCHFQPASAERCLRNIEGLVKPGGYLCVSGVDLDVRTKVAVELGWKPVTELIREVHDGDDSIRRGWPLEYWGLEPLDESRPDWQIRYSSVFQLGDRLR